MRLKQLIPEEGDPQNFKMGLSTDHCGVSWRRAQKERALRLRLTRNNFPSSCQRLYGSLSRCIEMPDKITLWGGGGGEVPSLPR